MALSDLGGLGDKEGPPVVYNWTLPNLLPVLLPWLAVLLLLLLKPNRCAQAWWIWAPVACVAGLAAEFPSVLSFIPSAEAGFLVSTIASMGFGVAALWLLAGYLGWKQRALAWLGTLLVSGIFSFLTFGMRELAEGVGAETAAGGVLLTAATVVIATAVTLAGLACRGRYAPVRLLLWLLAALLVLWLLVVGPFALVAAGFGGGGAPALAVLGVVLTATALSFGVVLPFLVLSFANAFFRARLKDLLHVGRDAAPPVLPPLEPAVPAAAGT